jgi:LmbE family N-acetylglucosaminyl deacetylase
MPAILCVFAHPDDESFGPAGTIAHYVAQGVPVDVLTFTRGQRGARPAPLQTPEDLGRLRAYELRAACAVLGVRKLTLLDYMDGELDRTDANELADHVLAAMRDSSADTLITFGPLGITRHGDHIAAHRGAMAAAGRSDRPLQVFYAALELEWAKRMNLELDGPEIQPTHRIDTSGFAEQKLMALACHSSQEDAREFFMQMLEGMPREELYHRARPGAEPGRTYSDLFE